MRYSMIDERLIHSKVENTLYVHDSFSSMFRGMLNWIQDGFDKRFNYKVMATYDKAVQFFNQKKQSKDGNVSANILPSVTLDPNLDFVNEERSGKFPWMFPNLDNVHGRYFNDKIDLKEQGVTISIMRTRYGGTCDITFWLQSIYELMDIRTKLIQYCNGIGRWIRPDFFWTHVILPKEIIEFDRYDGKKLDWSATPVEIIQLATTNSSEYAISYPLNAIWRLDSISDGSTKYGADQLTEWKMTATFTWECDIPTFIRLDNYSFYDMRPTVAFGLGPVYSDQPLLNKIDTLVELTNNVIIDKYMAHAQVYTIAENKSPYIKMDSTQCYRFPTFYKEYNHIVSGKLYTYEKLVQLEESGHLPDKFIFLMDRYDDSYISMLRKATGCINHCDDNQSEFYTLINSINLPTFCSIADNIYKALCKKEGQEFTIDPVAGTIYTGICQWKRLNSDEITYKENYDVCNRLIDFFKTHNIFQDKRYKNLNMGDAMAIFQNREDVIGKYIENQSEYRFPIPLNSAAREKFKLFVNDELVASDKYDLYSHKIEFHDDVIFEPGSVLKIQVEGYLKIYSIGNAVNYHITKEDEKAYYTQGKRIEIDIPSGFNTDYIKCCSYNGILNEHYDYEVNEDKTKIVFKLIPQRDKVIQVFMNRK